MKILSCTLLFIIALPGLAQPPPEEAAQHQDIIEDMVESMDEEFEYDTYLEQLENYRLRPLNLNEAGRMELEQLILLTDEQISALQEYKNRYGQLKSIYELKVVDHFDTETIFAIAPYVTVAPVEKISLRPVQMLTRGRSQLFLRYQQVLEQQKGYTMPDSTNPDATRYLGSPYRLYARYRYTYFDRLSIGLTAEKDPGEEFFRGSQPQGFDYYSAHFFLSDIGPLKSLAIGDYAVQFGQGLVAWSGFGYGKSTSVMDVRKSSYPLKPYTAVRESNFLRGAAASVKAGDFLITTFGSRNRFDATVSRIDTLDEEVQAISALQETGYHRTPTELKNKDAVTASIGGAHVLYRHRLFDIGVSAIHTRLSAPLDQRMEPYNRFRFFGKVLTNAGIHYTFLYRGFLFFGETAVSDNGGWATLNGLAYSLDSKTAISLVHRNYQQRYQTLYGNAFGESSGASNEKGIYLGVDLDLGNHIKLRGYMDFYEHPWLRFLIDAPSRGQEYFGQLTYRPQWGTEMYLRMKHELKEKNKSGNDAPIDFLVETRKTNARYHITKNISSRLVLKSRLELAFFRETGKAMEKGVLLYQDLSYRFERVPLRMAARFAVFDMDSYNTRIYAYENDVLYAFSVPAYFNRGSRFFLLLQYDFGYHLDAWLRIAQTFSPEEEVIGSGLEEIEGQRKTEIKAQIRLKF